MKSLTTIEKVSRRKKKSHTKRKILVLKEKVSRQKKNSHAERNCLAAKKNSSQQNKENKNSAKNKLKTIVINKTINTVLL